MFCLVKTNTEIPMMSDCCLTPFYFTYEWAIVILHQLSTFSAISRLEKALLELDFYYGRTKFDTDQSWQELSLLLDVSVKK
jgi:hypothetical protein